VLSLSPSSELAAVDRNRVELRGRKTSREGERRREKGERIGWVWWSIRGGRRVYGMSEDKIGEWMEAIESYSKTRLTGKRDTKIVNSRNFTSMGTERRLLTSSATDSSFSISVLILSSLIASKCSLHSIGKEFQHLFSSLLTLILPVPACVVYGSKKSLQEAFASVCEKGFERVKSRSLERSNGRARGKRGSLTMAEENPPCTLDRLEV